MMELPTGPDCGGGPGIRTKDQEMWGADLAAGSPFSQLRPQSSHAYSVSTTNNPGG